MADRPIAVVTGANGFVGSHLVDLLLENRYDVRCIIRKSSNVRWLNNKQVSLFDCGLYDIPELEKAFQGAEYIFHIAGVIKSKKKEGYYHGNVESAKCVLEAAVRNAVNLKKVVVVSSQTAAGPTTGDRLKSEDDPCIPITTYGKSKLEQEKLSSEYFDKLPITICRPPAVYGERDTEIFIFFNSFAKGMTTTIGFDKKEISLIHVKDLARGLFLAAQSPNSASQTYFITSPETYTWEQIIELTAKAFGMKAIRLKIPHSVVYLIAGIAQFISLFQKSAATLNIEKARDITQHAWTCSPEKAKKDLLFTAEISLAEGIKSTVDWYKQAGWIR